MACKYETSNGRCGLKGCYAYRHKCYTEDMCKCHEPPTNADRIRAMSDEELAEKISCRCIRTLCDIVCVEDCKAFETLNKTSHQRCVEIVLDWLKRPAE